MITIYPVEFDFLGPYCEEEGYVRFALGVDKPDFVLVPMLLGNWPEKLQAARVVADKFSVPVCYWTIEDPNSYRYTIQQAKLADYVFTSDACLLPRYRTDLGHNRVFWLPLAASLKYHYPLPLAADATDFVFSGNWYDYIKNLASGEWTDTVRNEARKWGSHTVILPLARAGYSITIYSYEEPPYPELVPFWKGLSSCREVAEQYSHGRIVLGNNNQRNGYDGIERTFMASMRVFEALACGKVYLSAWTEAYAKLGLYSFVGTTSSISDTESWGKYFFERPGVPNRAPLWELYSKDGREFVVANHLYRHRMERIMRAIQGEAKPEEWR